MAFKFIAFFALLAVARAGLLPAGQIAYAAAPAAVVKAAPVAYAAAPAAVVKAAPVAVAQPVLAKAVDEYDPHPQYKFGYEVQDSLSGDSKSQVETRDGDVVQGEYSLIDADGYKRTVQYTADPVNGFNAVVNREPLGVAVKTVAAAPVVKAVAPVAYAAPAPVVKTVAAPLAYAAPAPVVKTYAAPVTYAAPAPVVKTYAAPLAYAAAPVVKAYAAPAVVKAAPLAYSAPVAYSSPAIVKSYAAPTVFKTYAAAPAYAFAH